MVTRRVLITIAAVIVVALCILGAGALASGDPVEIEPIEETSACPVTGCASGTCHSYDDVPEPDGVTLLYCPETDCSDVECHAWDTLIDRYYQASSLSLTLWIIIPVIIVLVIVVLMRAMRGSYKETDQDEVTIYNGNNGIAGSDDNQGESQGLPPQDENQSEITQDNHIDNRGEQS